MINPQGYVEGVPSNNHRPKCEDAPLLLSIRAQSRAYFPEGILNHHHAVQFVSFAPPFEITRNSTTITTAAGKSRMSTSSHDDALSSLGSEYSDYDRSRVHASGGNVVASLAHGQKRDNPPSPKSVGDFHMADAMMKNSFSEQRQPQQLRPVDQSKTKPEAGVRGLFSRLNCCRTNQKSGATIAKVDSSSSIDGSLNIPPYRDSSLAALSEEEELRWLGYSMKPIAEDQSLASNSVISMSAPLLSPPAEMEMIDENSYLPQSAGAFPQEKKRDDHRRASTNKGGVVDRNSYEYGRRAMYEF